MFCPMAAPATGDTCNLASQCRYYGPVTASDPVTTYRGDCTCDGAHWSCTPSESSDCPTTQPRPFFAGDLCMPSAGNRGCWYPPAAGSDLWTNCHCDGPSGLTELWTCNGSAHF